jgi:hypothetical protein
MLPFIPTKLKHGRVAVVTQAAGGRNAHACAAQPHPMGGAGDRVRNRWRSKRGAQRATLVTTRLLRVCSRCRYGRVDRHRMALSSFVTRPLAEHHRVGMAGQVRA